MGYRALADATMLVHFAFLGYVVAGGVLAWRWSVMIWPHLVLAGWGLSTLVFHQDCPLSKLENWARLRAGEPGLKHDGFIATYLTGVVYPAHYLWLVQLLAAVVIVVTWAGALRRRRRPPSRSLLGAVR